MRKSATSEQSIGHELQIEIRAISGDCVTVGPAAKSVGRRGALRYLEEIGPVRRRHECPVCRPYLTVPWLVWAASSTARPGRVASIPHLSRVGHLASLRHECEPFQHHLGVVVHGEVWIAQFFADLRRLPEPLVPSPPLRDIDVPFTLVEGVAQ